MNLIKDNCSASDRFLAFWLDNRLKVNYVIFYAHISPDQLMPDRPLILRVALFLIKKKTHFSPKKIIRYFFLKSAIILV